jgi:hypothetical protein
MTDEQDRSEALDDDKLEDLAFPPDKPIGVQAYGAAGTDPPVGESVAARAAREEPDWIADAAAGEHIELLDNTADVEGATDLDDGETGDAIEGRLAEGDPGRFSGGGPGEVVPAEEAAMHVIEP